MAELATRTDTAAAMQRLIDFVNTLDCETGVDEWDSPEALGSWLRAHGVLDQCDASHADLQRARALREGLRQALLAHDGHAEEDAAGVAVVVPLQLRIGADGGAVLGPAADGTSAALAELVAAIPAAQTDGTWWRLKACPADDCRWAFVDKSRNRSRRWCSMEVCGNREKTRTFRSRRRDD